MKFQYPEFLYALFAIAIPIIIHLFNFRRYKKIYFSNVRFLKDVEETTRAQSKLRQILVLLARILAISFLVFAFAQPYIPSETGNSDQEKKVISIYLDNSFSMESSNTDGNRFEIARQYAYEIVKSFDPTTQFQVLNNAFSGKQQRLYSKEDALQLIDEIEIGPEVRNVSEIIQRQKALLEENEIPDKRCYIISDFQKGILDINQVEADTFANLFFVPIGGDSPLNLSVDSIHFVSPARQVNSPINLLVTFENKSNIDANNVRVSIAIDGEQKGSSTTDFSASEAFDSIVPILVKEPGIHHGKIEIEGDEILFDNTYYFSFKIRDQINITEIRGTSGSDNIQLAYSKEPLFQYNVLEATNVDPSILNQSDVIILNQLDKLPSGLVSTVNTLVNNGITGVVIPSTKANLDSYNQYLSGINADLFTAIDSNRANSGKLNLNHTLFSDVFTSSPKFVELPKISKRFGWNITGRSQQEVIMKADNGAPLIGQYNYGNGKYNVFSFPVDKKNSNFTKHSLFLPLFYMMGFQSEKSQPLAYFIGEDNYLSITDIAVATDQPLHLVSKDKSIDIIPPVEKTGRSTFLNLSEMVENAGHYEIVNKQAVEEAVAFNYNRKESFVDIPSLDRLKEIIAESGWNNIQLIEGDYSTISSTIEEINQGTNYWKWCLILVLVFFGIEILLLRFLK